MSKLGRKSKLTPEVQDTIVKALRGGAYMKTAAEYAGVSERSVMRWLEQGQAPDPAPLPASATKAQRTAREEYLENLAKRRQFWQSTREAIAASEMVLISRLQEASRGETVSETTTTTHPDGSVTTRTITRTLPVNVAATTFLAERRFHDRWGRKDTIAHTGADGTPLVALGGLVTTDPAAMEAARALRDSVAKAGKVDEAHEDDSGEILA